MRVPAVLMWGDCVGRKVKGIGDWVILHVIGRRYSSSGPVGLVSPVLYDMQGILAESSKSSAIFRRFHVLRANRQK